MVEMLDTDLLDVRLVEPRVGRLVEVEYLLWLGRRVPTQWKSASGRSRVFVMVGIPDIDSIDIR